MDNFIYSVPTKVYFGKGQVNAIADIVKQYGNKVLIVYGGGSIKKNGLYTTVTGLFDQNGIKYVELSGVEPNPRVTTVKKGVELCRNNQVDVVLPIGGGSTIDCVKAVAASVAYNGDPWDLVLDNSLITSALPVVTILTLAATGTEMDPFAVISNMETNDKMGIASEYIRPAVSILDPENTYTVNAYQTAAGTVDIMSHTLEGYFSNLEGYLQDRFAEAVLKTCIHYGPIALAKPDDYEARANLMWAGSWALEGLLQLGKPVGSTVHPMEHQLSAYYDITHGAGLALLTPAWMTYVLSDKTVDKFKEYGVNVWGISPDQDKWEIAKDAIAKTKAFFQSLHMPSTLREVNIPADKLDEMAQKAAVGLDGAYVPLTAADVKKIYESVL